jgi:phage-related protein
MAANPILLVVSVLGALATSLITAYHTSEDFRNSVDQAWASLKEGASTAFENLKTTLGDIGGAISEAAGAIKEKVSEFIQAGRDLIQGLIDGISEKISSIGTAVKNAAGKVVDWFDEKFDRHSPSKVFAEMGRDLMRGLEVGINGEAPNVQRTIDGLRFKAPTIQTGRISAKDSMMGKTSAASISNAIALASGSGGNGQPVTINLVMDSRTMAQVLFDPLSGVAKQKGTPIGTW